MKIESLRIPVTKQPPPAAKTGVTHAKPTAATGRPGPQPAAPKPKIAEDERRKTQRVLLRVRANIHVALQGKTTTLDAATVSVNPRGALVVMDRSLPAETRLVLEHRGTHEQIACKVARAPRQAPEGFHTALEFESPAPDFWKIAFPPADWRSDE